MFFSYEIFHNCVKERQAVLSWVYQSNRESNFDS